jgi:hypothetical protein
LPLEVRVCFFLSLFFFFGISIEIPLLVAATPGYGHTNEEDIKEFYEHPDEIRQKVKLLVEAMREAKYIVAYTGAGSSEFCQFASTKTLPTGISTGQLPDYRGPKSAFQFSVFFH